MNLEFITFIRAWVCLKVYARYGHAYGLVELSVCGRDSDDSIAQLNWFLLIHKDLKDHKVSLFIYCPDVVCLWSSNLMTLLLYLNDTSNLHVKMEITLLLQHEQT